MFFFAGVEVFSEESMLCFQAAYVRAEAQYRTPLIVCQVFRVRGACLSSLRAAADIPFFLLHGSALVVPQGGEGKGAAGLSLCIRD